MPIHRWHLVLRAAPVLWLEVERPGVDLSALSVVSQESVVEVSDKGTQAKTLPQEDACLRVLALGSNSSQQGRNRALAFSRFSVNPLVQRSMTIGSQILLPANRFVKVPVQSSQRLAALVTAAKDSAQTANLAAMLHSRDPRLPRIKRLLSELVFGDLPERQASRQVLAILGQSR